MYKTPAMTSFKTPESKSKKFQDGVVSSLKDLFGNTIANDTIRSVAVHCDFDVQRSSNVLLEMSNNIKRRTKNNIPNKPQPRPSPTRSKKSIELDRVFYNIRSGYKVLVILRGLPGSGKSHLAMTITDVTLGPGNNSHHILSTDDFFVQQRGYVFDPNKLQEAHEWNHRRAFRAMSQGLSPVIIDNTNTQMWEMKPYATMATDYGYMIEVVEPATSWFFDEKELARRTIHKVPRTKIRDMLERYDKNVTAHKLLLAYKLQYKFQQPPQLRLLPQIQNGYVHHKPAGVTKSKSTSAIQNGFEPVNLMDFTDIEPARSQVDSLTRKVDPMDEILMCTNESPADVLQPSQVGTSLDIENAWGVDEKALQSWDIVTPLDYQDDIKNDVHSGGQDVVEIRETREFGTCVEPGDHWPVRSKYKTVETRNRDINSGVCPVSSTPPRRIMVDQSCVTDDLEDATEDRLQDLVDLFPRIPRPALLELFNKCNMDFHWTVDLLLEDVNWEVTETRQQEETECVKKVESSEYLDERSASHNSQKVAEEKLFKRKPVSAQSLELKKCLESRIDINSEHYSEHVLKVKQTKFGGFQEAGSAEPQPSSSTVVESDTESDDDSHTYDNPKDFIELNLGETFVNQLETMFGSDDSVFPQGYQPVVQMPKSLARQIYSLYIESVCQQMETQNNILDGLDKEDEEFARKLQTQEEARLEQERPLNFKEIMDEQLALNMHRRDTDEWKNMTADTLAAKLTKQKLFGLFPNIDKESLVEIWHAYDYDFAKTVDDLIVSVGVENVNGSKETIREPPLNRATLDEMKEAETCSSDTVETVEQKSATFYREEANKHLKRRTDLYEKAQSYYQRGMTEVAMFYSGLAKKETKSFDMANHIAAVAYVEEHSKRLQKFDTLDLHYLYVKEALPNLDIFIDRNINLLKGGTKTVQELFIITGRGKNSYGGRCKIKPAVITRLKKRKIWFLELNPGLLKIRVTKDSAMTSDLVVSSHG